MEKIDLPKFSVVMSIYSGDIPEQVSQAIESILKQTLPPNEFIIVIDGPISEALSHETCSKSGSKYGLSKST